MEGALGRGETRSEMSKEQQEARMAGAGVGGDRARPIGPGGHGEALPSVLSWVEGGSAETTGRRLWPVQQEVALAGAPAGRGEKRHFRTL